MCHVARRDSSCLSCPLCNLNGNDLLYFLYSACVQQRGRRVNSKTVYLKTTLIVVVVLFCLVGVFFVCLFVCLLFVCLFVIVLFCLLFVVVFRVSSTLVCKDLNYI